MKKFLTVAGGVVALVAGLLGPAGPVNAAMPVISGTVSSINGPVEDGKVYFFHTCQDYANRAATAVATIASGSYSALVPAGSYRVYIEPDGDGATDSWHAGAATCESATVVNVSVSANLNLIAAPLYTVTGTVRSSAGLMANAAVTFYSGCEQFYAEQRSSVASAITDANGVYSVGVPAGTYRVRILAKPPTWDYMSGRAPSWHSATTRCEDATAVVVAGNLTIDLTASPAVNVTGGVSSFHGPITQGEVRFYATCADYLFDKDRSVPSRAAATALMDNGSYTVLVAAGVYRVFVNPFGSATSLASWHAGASTCESAAEVVVAGSGAIPLVIRGVGNVTGTVTAGKAPVAQGWLTFFADCESARTGQMAAFFGFTGGSFTTTLPDGSYVVKISNNAARDSWHSAAQGCADATAVIVSGQSTLQLRGLTAAQTVKRPPKRLKHGKRVVLARKTDRLTRVHWRSLTKEVCSVRKSTLRGLRKGTCRVSAQTSVVMGLDTLSRKFKVRIV